jgi:hypothetical protein
MTEALTALLEFGFETLGLNRIEALVMPDNAASFALLNKLGFSEEGLLREYDYFKDEFQDLICFSLLRREFSPTAPDPASESGETEELAELEADDQDEPAADDQSAPQARDQDEPGGDDQGELAGDSQGEPAEVDEDEDEPVADDLDEPADTVDA